MTLSHEPQAAVSWGWRWKYCSRSMVSNVSERGVGNVRVPEEPGDREVPAAQGIALAAAAAQGGEHFPRRPLQRGQPLGRHRSEAVAGPRVLLRLLRRGRAGDDARDVGVHEQRPQDSPAFSVSLSDENRMWGGKALPGVSRPPASGFMIISATPCRLARGKISVLFLGMDSDVTPEAVRGNRTARGSPGCCRRAGARRRLRT